MSDPTRADGPAVPLRRAAAARLLLSSPGLFGQGFRFATAGGTVMVVYLGSTTLLADVVGLPFQVALAIGFGLAMAVHFTLQRLFVWAQPDEFALSIGHQAARYLALSAAQYGVTAASTAVLPDALGVETEVVYLVTVAVLVCTNFLVFRHGIFHPKRSPSTPASSSPAVPPR